MTHLRKVMLEELERRNYTESTTRAYLRTVEDFARFFHRPRGRIDSSLLARSGSFASLDARAYKNMRALLLKARRMAVTNTEYVAFQKTRKAA